MPIKCLVVDDEQLARKIIIEFIHKIPELELAGECKSALDAIRFLNESAVDLLFLDINMPDLSGIEFLETVAVQPKVILTTAYSEFALKGYELNIVDYLLKPFSFQRFLKAVQKAQDRTTPPTTSTQNSNEKQIQDNTTLTIKANNKLYVLNKSDIWYIEGLKEYVSIYTTNKERLVTLESLKNLAAQLGESDFIRIHKSYIIPLKKINFIEGNYVQIGDKQLPIGKVYKPELLNRL